MKHATVLTVLGHSPLPMALPIEVDTDHDDHLNLHELVELVKKVMVAQNKPWINKYEVGSQILVHAKPACLRCLSFSMRAVFVQLYCPVLEATLARKAQEAMHQFDANGDGLLSFAEFCLMMSTGQTAPRLASAQKRRLWSRSLMWCCSRFQGGHGRCSCPAMQCRRSAVFMKRSKRYSRRRTSMAVDRLIEAATHAIFMYVYIYIWMQIDIHACIVC